MANLNSIEIDKWNTNRAVDMSSMFKECSSLKNVDLSSFNTKNCKNFDDMFQNCNADLEVKVDTQKCQNMVDAIKDHVHILNID